MFVTVTSEMTILVMTMSLEIGAVLSILVDLYRIVKTILQDFTKDIHKTNPGRSSHWGTFVCKAANPLGQDTAEITLTGELSSELVSKFW